MKFLSISQRFLLLLCLDPTDTCAFSQEKKSLLSSSSSLHATNHSSSSSSREATALEAKGGGGGGGVDSHRFQLLLHPAQKVDESLILSYTYTRGIQALSSFFSKWIADTFLFPRKKLNKLQRRLFPRERKWRKLLWEEDGARRRRRRRRRR